MKLSQSTVHQLIDELSSVIEYNLNIMDEKGTIIASTDPERIGQFHEAALLIIDQDLPSLLVHHDGEYHGCREGTNVPLLVDGEIIGVLGITGNVDDTSKYASIIKKTAEILLKDYSELSQRTRLNEARMFFLNSWLNGEVRDADRIRRKLEQYGSHPSSRFQVAIIDNIRGHDPARAFLTDRVSSIDIITTWNNSYGIIIGMFESTDELCAYLESILTRTTDRDDFFFAVGDTVGSEDLLHRSYAHAFSLLRYVKKRSEALGIRYSGISRYEDHILELIMGNVPDGTRSEYLSSVFSDVDAHNLEDMVSFILTYCEHNGSINGIAKDLFIHKNTVQYKIRRIRDLTGLDLRSNLDMIRLHAAAEWFLLS